MSLLIAFPNLLFKKIYPTFLIFHFSSSCGGELIEISSNKFELIHLNKNIKTKENCSKNLM